MKDTGKYAPPPCLKKNERDARQQTSLYADNFSLVPRAGTQA